MKRFSLVAAAGAVAVLAPLGAATSAQAAGPEPFTLTVNITLGPNGPELETFTATGALCPSGTFADTKVILPSPDQAGKFVIIGQNVYTCNDGSGTFNVMAQTVGTAVTDDFATTTGTVQILGGTGTYTNLTGHGSGTGSINFATGTATATTVGVVVRS
jgi:hypothetical protein